MSDKENILLALDLAAGLASRLLTVIAAIQRADGEGRPISAAELDGFARSDDAAGDRLKAKIAARRGKGE